MEKHLYYTKPLITFLQTLRILLSYIYFKSLSWDRFCLGILKFEITTFPYCLFLTFIILQGLHCNTVLSLILMLSHMVWFCFRTGKASATFALATHILWMSFRSCQIQERLGFILFFGLKPKWETRSLLGSARFFPIPA